MRRLPKQTRIQILLNMLVEGMSMRSISRVAFDSIHSVAKLLFDAGEFRAECHDRHVCDITARKVQYDEIWPFIYCKNVDVKRAMAASREAVDAWI